MSAPRDPSGQEPTWQGTSTPPAGEPVFKTKLSYADVQRTTRKAPRRASPQVPGWRRQILRTIAVLAALLAITAAILAGYDIYGIQQQGNAPLNALQQFCAYEAQQDYADAYNLVSIEYTQFVSLDDFVNVNTTRDQRYGKVTGCSQIQRDYTRAFGPMHAAFSLTVTTTMGTYHGAALLAAEGKPPPGSLAPPPQPVWTIDQVTPEAHLDQ